MPDISKVTSRRPITRYRFTDLAGTVLPAMVNANQWYNITDFLAPAVPSLDLEVGTLYDGATVGDEAIVTQWEGAYRAELSVRMTGGTLAQATYIGIMQDQAGLFPRAIATVPPGNRDIHSGDVERRLVATWQVEGVKANLAPDLLPAGSRLQAVIASANAGEVVTLISIELVVEHLHIAASGARL